jgi:hypothetical protein
MAGTLTVGNVQAFTGDISTLNAIGGPRPPADIEAMLGYRAGRLSQGYYILLLVEELRPEDFVFAGTTLRSGGRAGLPQKTKDADKLRQHVTSDRIREERKHVAEGIKQSAELLEYIRQQEHALKTATYRGPNRLAKVLPVERISGDFSPEVEFPMGGGGKQWTIETPKSFLIALQVTDKLEAITPKFTVSLVQGPQAYDNRAKVARYLESA